MRRMPISEIKNFLTTHRCCNTLLDIVFRSGCAAASPSAAQEALAGEEVKFAHGQVGALVEDGVLRDWFAPDVEVPYGEEEAIYC